MQNYSGYNGTDYYLYCKFRQSPDTATTHAIYCDFSEDEADIISDENGLTIQFVKSHSYLFVMSWGQNTFRDPSAVTITKIVIDSSSNSILFFNGDTQTYPFDEIYLVDYETNIAQASPLPDVSVRFKPSLNGDVSRIVQNEDGTSSMLQDLQMYITNNSNFSIQYKLSITLANQLTTRPDSVTTYDKLLDHYDDDPVFVYYSNSVVYDRKPSSGNTLEDLLLFANSYNKASEWHMLGAHQSSTVTIPFSMINLVEGNSYNVKVETYKLDYDMPSELFGYDGTSDHRFIDPDTYFLAYDSTFKMLQYKDVKYDPTKTSGDVLPFDGSNAIDQYKYDNNYDAVTDLEGNVTIKHEDKLDELKQRYENGGSFGSSLDSNSFSNVTLDSFSSTFSNVFGFVSLFLSFLPSAILYLFILGFSCIVIIAIIKSVR